MNIIALVIAILIALLIGVSFRQYLIDSMSNVSVAQEATDYLQRDTVNITMELDTYLFTNISVIPKPHQDEPEDKIDDDDNFNNDADDYSSDDSDSDSDSGGSDGGDGGD